jgi:ABC-type hemin transport system substrate-binding protein
MLGNLVGTVRRNHALEHATIAVLLRRLGHDIRMVGRATKDGYYLYADVPTDLLEESTREALYRLKAGEGHLAVSSLCGTNLAVAGALAGAASLLTMGGSNNRTEKIPNVVMASMLAVIAAQPVGRMVQRYLTTSPDLSDTEIVAVKPSARGGARFHKVQTRRGA